MLQIHDGDEGSLIVTASSGDCDNPAICLWKRREGTKTRVREISWLAAFAWLWRRTFEVIIIAMAIHLVVLHPTIEVRLSNIVIQEMQTKTCTFLLQTTLHAWLWTGGLNATE